MHNLLFDNFTDLFKAILTAMIVYILIVVMVKLSGKRSTSQLNNFDWIVTVMMGSIGASTVILDDLPVVEGIAAMATLLLMQYIATWWASRSTAFARTLLSSPTVVFYNGEYLPDAMHRERLTVQEIECAMRQAGVLHARQVKAVILESDAKFTVLQYPEDQDTGKLTQTDDPQSLIPSMDDKSKNNPPNGKNKP